MAILHTKSPSYCEPFYRSGTTQSKIAINLGRLFSTMPASYLHIYVFIHFFEIIITMRGDMWNIKCETIFRNSLVLQSCIQTL